MSNKPNERNMGIIYLTDEQVKSLIIYIKTHIKYIFISFDNGLITLSKMEKPNWRKSDKTYHDKRLYSIENNKNTNYYEYVLIKLNNDNLYFYEQRGQITFVYEEMVKISKPCIEFKQHIIQALKNKNKWLCDNLIDVSISNYKLHEIKTDIDLIPFKDIVIYLNDIYDVNYNSVTQLSTDVPIIDKLLPEYTKISADNHNKNKPYTETAYNKHVCINYPDKFRLLDCKCVDGIEVADIYCKEINAFIHIKRTGDQRITVQQIINGALVLKNDTMRKKYLKKIHTDLIDVDFNTFIYVIAIFCPSDKRTLKPKDMLSIGTCKYMLSALGITLQLHYFNDTTKE